MGQNGTLLWSGTFPEKMNIKRWKIQDSLMTLIKRIFSRHLCRFSQHLKHMKLSRSQGSKAPTGQETNIED